MLHAKVQGRLFGCEEDDNYVFIFCLPNMSVMAVLAMRVRNRAQTFVPILMEALH